MHLHTISYFNNIRLYLYKTTEFNAEAKQAKTERNLSINVWMHANTEDF